MPPHEALNRGRSANEGNSSKKGSGSCGSRELLEMGTLRCDLCGEEFLIQHYPGSADKKNAEKQAHWLEKVLAEEHERDKKHPDRIELPD
jgi:hypothetical protein